MKYVVMVKENELRNRKVRVMVSASAVVDLNIGHGAYEDEFDVDENKEFRVDVLDDMRNQSTILFPADVEVSVPSTHVDGDLTVKVGFEYESFDEEDEDGVF